MKLSWRDVVTTMLLIIGAILVYANLQNWNWWLVDGWRGLTLALGAVGIAMCIAAAGDIENRSILNRLQSWLGMFSFFLIALGLVFGDQLIALTLAGVISAEWLISTARHTRHSLMEINLMHHRPTTHSA